MTPKEKATDLIDSYYVLLDGFVPFEKVQQCALIAVDEILQSLGYKKLSDSPYTTLEARQYYVQVKEEIKAL